MKEMVNHPAHYGGADNPYEVIKVIDAWQLGFALGNVIKYIARAKHKGSELEDLKKARWYLDHEIERLKAETDGYLCPFCKSRCFGSRATRDAVFCTCGATVHWPTEKDETWHAYADNDVHSARTACGKLLTKVSAVCGPESLDQVDCKECSKTVNNIQVEKPAYEGRDRP